MRIESFGLSDIGLSRLNNEDVWAQMPKEQFFVLADGMGGHQAGEVAANETVIFLCSQIKKVFSPCLSIETWASLLEEGIEKANSWIYELASKDEELQGMGTTICACLFLEDRLVYAHVGDSRIYRVRKGRITPLTEDHSLRAELIAKGKLEPSKSRSFPRKNVITRAIGTQRMVVPEIDTTEVEEGDLYFLCSDGLTDKLSDDKILSIIESAYSLEDAGKELILAAKMAGSEDNITLLLTQIVN